MSLFQCSKSVNKTCKCTSVQLYCPNVGQAVIESLYILLQVGERAVHAVSLLSKLFARINDKAFLTSPNT